MKTAQLVKPSENASSNETPNVVMGQGDYVKREPGGHKCWEQMCVEIYIRIRFTDMSKGNSLGKDNLGQCTNYGTMR